MTTLRIFRLVFCVAALCSPGISANAQTVRDSAGIRIVMNTKPTWNPAQQLKLSTKPTLVIGDRDEVPYQFTRIGSPFCLSDGRIVVAERAANELRVFDATGKYLQTFGHKGDGPGEFRSVSKVMRVAGDTIAVLHENAMVSRFTSAGRYITRSNDRGNVDLSKPGATSTGVFLALNGGARLTLSMPLDPKGGTVGTEFDAKALHTVIGGAGTPLNTLGELAYMQAVSGKDHADKPWLGAEEVFAGNGSQFYLGYGTQYSLTRYSASGVPNLIVRRAWTASPITPKEYEEFTEEWLKRWTKSTGAKLEAERKELLASDYFKKLPAYSAIVLDNTGRLWVRTPKSIDGAVAGSLNDYSVGESTWSVFSPTGVWLGDVTMPPKFSPTDIGVDYVLGIARNDDGTPTVARYKLSTG